MKTKIIDKQKVLVYLDNDVISGTIVQTSKRGIVLEDIDHVQYSNFKKLFINKDKIILIGYESYKGE